jgi:hypothetical protein
MVGDVAMADEKVPDAYKAVLEKERELDAAVTKKALEFTEAIERLPTAEARRFHLAALAKSVGHLMTSQSVDPEAIGLIIRRGILEGERFILERMTARYGKGN